MNPSTTANPVNESQRLIRPATAKETAAVTQSTTKGAVGWQICDFQHAMRSSLEKPPWVIEDLLLEQTATLVSAHPHAMKSLSWLYACLEAVVKKQVWGHFKALNVESVLFVETEDPSWVVEARIKGFAKGLGIAETTDVPGFHYACVGPFDLPNTEHYIVSLIEKLSPNFMVISTLQSLLAGRDWKEQTDMQPVMAAIVRLSRACPIVLLTHSPWDSHQRRAAGTVTQTANFLTTMHYKKAVNQKTKETFLHVLTDSKVGALETNFSLKLLTEGDPRDPAGVRGVEYVSEGWPKGLGKAAVLAAIEDDPDASPKEIADRTGMGVRYVQKMRKKGKK